MNIRKRIIFCFTALLFFTLFFLIIFGRNGYVDLNRLKQENRTLSEKNMKIEMKNLKLHRTIERLKNDPEYIESVARQEFGMIGKDELILKFKEEKRKK